MFTLSIDSARSLLTMTLSGYWADADMTQFEQKLPVSLAELGRLRGPTLCLIDATAFPVQGAAIADRHARLLAAMEPTMANHIAIVLPSALARAQARRISQTSRQRFFDNREQALAWLVSVRAGAMPIAA